MVKQAFEVAIDQVYAFGRSQSDAFECLLVARDDPCGSAAELMLEGGSHVLVESQHIFVLSESFAVWRVDHDKGAVGVVIGQAQLLYADLLDLDVALEVGRLDILGSSLHGIEARIGAIYLMLEVAFAAVVARDIVEEVSVEVGPFLECKPLAIDARCDVACDECCFDEQGTRSAHRVVEIALSVPSSEQ